MLTYDWLIVGAGFTGAVLAERLASQRGQKVLLIDRRAHIAGNSYDELDENGILVYRYGPHIFHTNSKKVWDYLSRFTTWRPYEHEVRAEIDGQLVPVPFNLNTLDALFPPDDAARLTAMLTAQFGAGASVPILKLREAEAPELRALAAFIYEKIFLHYTKKQWGRTPESLDPSVTGRVPVRVSRDNRYFQDAYQAQPVDGFTAMFRRILDHPNITLALNTPYESLSPCAARTVFTGPIDEYFDCVHGVLPYRSLRFAFVTKPQRYAQPVGTLNYPNAHAYTRVTEAKYLTGQEHEQTTLIYEYPEAYTRRINDPCYPIPCPESAALFAPYREAAEKLRGKVWFAGRLGDYQYYNMDQACGRALSLFEKELADV